MKTKKFLSIITIMLMFLLPSFSLAYSSNTSLSVEIARINTVNDLINRINILHKTAEQYMLLTADFKPTINKIDTFFDINKNIWKNYDKKGYMRLSVVTSKNQNAILIENIVLPNNVEIINYIKNSRRLDSLGVVNIKNRKIYVEFPFSLTLTSFMNIVEKDIPNEYPNGIVSYTAPIDSKVTTWLKPDGKGNLIVYQKEPNGQWNITGVYYLNKEFMPTGNIANYVIPETKEKIKPLIRVDKISKLKGKILPKSSIATDINGNLYVTDGNGNWYLISSDGNTNNK